MEGFWGIELQFPKTQDCTVGNCLLLVLSIRDHNLTLCTETLGIIAHVSYKLSLFIGRKSAVLGELLRTP